jgi:hypothetical protein
VGYAEARGEILRRGPYRVVRLREPGRLLSATEQAELLEMIIRESSASFGGDMRPYWESRPGYFGELSEWWLAHVDGEVAGWHGFTVLDHPLGEVAYYDSLNVMPAHRRTHLGSILTVEPYAKLLMLRSPRPAIALRTESAVVYRMLGRFVSYTYPIGARTHGRRYERALSSARLVAGRLDGSEGFDSRTFVMREALRAAGELYGEPPPLSGDDELDDYFERHVDAGRGDALLAIGFLSLYGVIRGLAALHAIRLRMRFEGRAGG